MPAGTPRGAAGATDETRARAGYPFGYAPGMGHGADAASAAVNRASVAHRGDLPETARTRPHGIWRVDERAAWQEARARGAGLVVAFVAEWSKPATELQREVLSSPAVVQAITSDFVALEIDVTEDTADNREQLERYRVLRLPVVLVLDDRGRQLDRIEAWLDSEAFMARLSSARARLPAMRAGL